MNSADWLRELVAHDTTSSNTNLPLIHAIERHLGGLGFQCVVDLSPDGAKGNLLARFGPENVPGVMLSGHSDTVPVAGQAWTVPAHALTERDDRLYGRGTADMKGFLACVIAAMPAFARAPLKRPIQLLISYDEEVGCRGVRSALARMAAETIRPRLCLIGEPTGMRPVLGHKGKLAMRCEVQGHACHSAYTPSGVNAIEYAAQLVVRLQELGRSQRVNGLRDERFDPPHATVQTGVIRGGRALNIVPAECSFDFEIRTLPGQDAQDWVDALREHARQTLEPEMQATSSSAGITLTELSSYPGLFTESASEAVALVAGWSECSDTSTVAYGTEGGLISRLGIPVVVCGPGSMDQGHKPDEYVTRAQLDRCDRMLARLLEWMQTEA
jgi:acetylornithine deacetylase